MEKTCTCCKLSLPREYFYINNYNGKSYRRSNCKNCQSKKIYEKQICECGKEYTKAHYKRHLRSNLHKRLMSIHL